MYTKALWFDSVTMAKGIVTCQDATMANDSERQKDLGLLDAAASGMSELANMELDAAKVSAEDFRAYCKVKIEAAKALVPILQRRAALLGLDAEKKEEPDEPDEAKPGTLAELERKLALVGPGKAS